MNIIFSALDLPVGIEETEEGWGQADGLRWEVAVSHHDHRKSDGGRPGSSPPCHLQTLLVRTVPGQDDHAPGMPLPLLHSCKFSLMPASRAQETTEGENCRRMGSASMAFWEARVCDNRPLFWRAVPCLALSPSSTLNGKSGTYWCLGKG